MTLSIFRTKEVDVRRMHFCSPPHEATCIFNGIPTACTRDANSTSTSYDTVDDDSFSRARAPSRVQRKKGSSTRDTSPVPIRAFQGQKSTSFAILFLVSPGPGSVYDLKTRAARLLAPKRKTKDPVPLLPVPKKYCARSGMYRDRLI